MKLKLAAAAALVAISGAANANIDNGAGGNGELFFNVWDANSSYTRDLNVTLDSFASAVNAAGAYLNQVSADSLFSSFLATADLASVKWSISATDINGDRRMLETYSVMPTGSAIKGADVIRTLAGNVSIFVNDLNSESKLASTDSLIAAVGTKGYAGLNSKYGSTQGGLLGFDRTGSVANSSYESGLGLLRIEGKSFGTTKGIYTAYADSGNALRAFLDLNQGSATFGQLTIAAPVPEPESYAMLLAGLGVMGAIARRRRNKQA